jgi:hypothetical protein
MKQGDIAVVITTERGQLEPNNTTAKEAWLSFNILPKHTVRREQMENFRGCFSLLKELNNLSRSSSFSL